MTQPKPAQASPIDTTGLFERLAAIEHDRWSHWQRYMHSRAERQPDGSLVIPADLVHRWERQIATAYGDLTEAERESDRNEVRRYWPLIGPLTDLADFRTPNTRCAVCGAADGELDEALYLRLQRVHIARADAAVRADERAKVRAELLAIADEYRTEALSFDSVTHRAERARAHGQAAALTEAADRIAPADLA